MVWICTDDYRGRTCGCCKSESGDDPPSVPCCRGHVDHWQRVDDVTRCDCWMGTPLPG